METGRRCERHKIADNYYPQRQDFTYCFLIHTMLVVSFLLPCPPPQPPRLEKLQTEHGLSMSKYAKLEEENALLESALDSLRAGYIVDSAIQVYYIWCSVHHVS